MHPPVRVLSLPLLLTMLWLVPTLGSANDTTLNTTVDPPRQLTEYTLPVRMESERLHIGFGEDWCEVSVEFVFANDGDEPAWVWAGFPDEDLLQRYGLYAPEAERADDPPNGFANEAWGDSRVQGLDDASVLTDFRSWTRGAGESEAQNVELPTLLVQIEHVARPAEVFGNLGYTLPDPDSLSAASSLMFCHSFELNLEPHERRIVGHSYRTRTGSNVEQQRLFNYTLSTGKTWQGRIGRAEIYVELLDGYTVDDLQFASPEAYAATTSPERASWLVLSNTELSLTWEDFEPEGAQGYLFLATKPVPPPGE